MSGSAPLSPHSLGAGFHSQHNAALRSPRSHIMQLVAFRLFLHAGTGLAGDAVQCPGVLATRVFP